ncbi:MAG: ABC transporter permease [Roseateles asaccharophilus]|uniref:Putative ABC transport system permease protein n=1 Tax=Roseateles asaccharophilus TaxID=582607 RepID=A0A4R6MRW9_9BURK|nr:FtsX-like permease family protein [Roseateles asaccharophilus]MDN3546581.1 ABC transporter permease [Roseateles asaccharophilus]TDP04997.1 putative ABC transport system permease protein [Roseateles asaccharophilus]
MDILPILSTLKRHKIAAGLIVVQIALTCAIVCNALFVITERLKLIQAPSGMADRELLVLRVEGLSRSQNPEAQTQADLAALRALPGVRAASLVSQLPFGRNSVAEGVGSSPDPRQQNINVGRYVASENWLPTLGLTLAEGRDFEPAEYADGAQVFKPGEEPKVPAVIINRALAERMFPGRSALGQPIYVYGATPQIVVGVLEHLPSPNPGVAGERERYNMVLPIRPTFRGGIYVLRASPDADRQSLLKAAAAALEQSSQGGKRLFRQQRLLEELRADYYRQDRFMVGLLLGVCGAMMLVTAFGIVGLASFWVQQRSRMIGTRRALGASQAQILRYFQTENLLLSALGIALGMALAYGINLLLMTQYELPRLPMLYLPLGALLLLGLGQLAVLGPARRAAALPPSLVMRGLN